MTATNRPGSDQSDVFAGPNSIGYVLRRCAKLMTQQAEALFEGGEFTFTQFITLCLIEFEIASTPGEIARNLGHNTGATTRMIDLLEAEGLLTRSRETDDRRVVTLKLTPNGSAAVQQYQQRMADFTRGILAGFDPSEVQVLMFLLRRLMAAFEAADSS